MLPKIRQIRQIILSSKIPGVRYRTEWLLELAKVLEVLGLLQIFGQNCDSIRISISIVNL